jgi:hypothetical protein
MHQHAVGERAFPVVDVCDYAKIANVIHKFLSFYCLKPLASVNFPQRYLIFSIENQNRHPELHDQRRLVPGNYFLARYLFIRNSYENN